MPTNFLEYSGGTNGFLATPFNLMTTELNGITNGAGVVSSVGGASGVFAQANWLSTMIGIGMFYAGTTFTPTAGGYLACWWLLYDGSNYETLVASNTDLPRPADCTIPLYASAYAANNFTRSGGIFVPPWWNAKLYVMNHGGATLPATGNIIKGASVAIQY
jgi:hypothetical protein